MEKVQFKINGKPYSVGCDVDSQMTLVEFLRNRAGLRGTKYMCLEAGCGACIVSVVKGEGCTPEAVNSCMVSILSCQNWDITTIEKLGNRLDGYHPIQKVLAKHNGTQCGHCSPGWVMSMYCLLESKPDITMLEIEKSLGSNICRCTGYRPILEAFKTFAKDAPAPQDINDIEDLHICTKKGIICKHKCDDDDWCVVSHNDVDELNIQEIHLEDGKCWYRVQNVNDIFNIFKTKGTDSYMLVAGNTAKGAYPIEEYPNMIIDISDVQELKTYEIDQNLVCGSGTTLTALLKIFDEFSQQNYFKYLRVLRDHLDLVAHIPVRNLGTIGGNLMIKHQHNEFPSDIYLLLETVGAQVTIVCSPKVTKIMTMQQFLNTDMKGKVILNVLFPPFNDEMYNVVTYKIMPRAQNAHAVVNAGFLYKYQASNNKVLESRIVYSGLSPSFTRAKSTELFLFKKELFTNDTLQSALKMLETELKVEAIPGEPSVAYRKQLALALFYKSLLSLCPARLINPRFQSGASKLIESRPVSQARQLFDTDPSTYPLTQPIPKIEALIQCAGEALYTEDHATYPHEVYAALVLSTVGTGEILSIDPSRALKQAGAIAFYSAKDIPGLNSFTPAEDPFALTNEEMFSSGQIKYFNQPIGVIAAEKKHIANRIAKMVDVTYKNVQKPIIDVKIAKNDSSRVSLKQEIDATETGNDVDKVIKANYTVRGQAHITMETIVCITKPTEEGLEVHTTTQWMDAPQSMIARALAIEQNRVDVHVRRLGGSFGLKISRNTLSAVACSLVSYKLNRPCRLIMPLTSITRALGKRFPCSSDYEVAVNSQGIIQYMNLDTFEDHGFMVNENLTFLAIGSYNNCYNPSRWKYRNFDTLTDTAKNSWFRAPGHLEAVSTVEVIMDHLSYEMSLDPLEVRLLNLDESASNGILDVLSIIKDRAEYNTRQIATQKFNTENRWKKRGLRASLLKWVQTNPRYFNVLLSVFHGDGTVIISHGGIEMGQGINTKAVQVCAYLLNLPLDKIQVKPNSTTISPNVSVSGGSLTTQYAIIGVRKCCLELLERLKPIREQMETGYSWAELIQKAFDSNVNLQVQGFAGSESELEYNIFAIGLAEVEVDILTGEREILRVDVVQDVGHSVSPEIDIGQIEGAFIMGLGYWVTEKLEYNSDTGEILTDRTWNYHVPQARDIPQDFRVYFRKNSYGETIIFGSKAVGEPPMCVSVSVPLAIRAAMTSARSDAGISTTTWFEIDGPFSLENVCLAAGTKISDFKFS
ncbi:probable aldehyde oxidase gad-3 [Ostrinia nubilalis]|uniref:probable aldehyde oxidase gad-3 n=1 Tax=Ostrinia nubilalis TaxID=29057 RepID=UPI0030822C2F